MEFNTLATSVRFWTEIGLRDMDGYRIKPQGRWDSKTYSKGISRKNLNHRDTPYILAYKNSCHGQSVNAAKSTLLFSSNALGGNIRDNKSLFELNSSQFISKHLGLPMFLERSNHASFQQITQTINQNIAN